MSKQTEKCVWCMGPVKWYSGHVIDVATGDEVIAGWCDHCGNDTQLHNRPDVMGRRGCLGVYHEQYGLMDDKRP